MFVLSLMIVSKSLGKTGREAYKPVIEEFVKLPMFRMIDELLGICTTMSATAPANVAGCC